MFSALNWVNVNEAPAREISWKRAIDFPARSVFWGGSQLCSQTIGTLSFRRGSSEFGKTANSLETAAPYDHRNSEGR